MRVLIFMMAFLLSSGSSFAKISPNEAARLLAPLPLKSQASVQTLGDIATDYQHSFPALGEHSDAEIIEYLADFIFDSKLAKRREFLTLTQKSKAFLELHPEKAYFSFFDLLKVGVGPEFDLSKVSGSPALYVEIRALNELMRGLQDFSDLLAYKHAGATNRKALIALIARGTLLREVYQNYLEGLSVDQKLLKEAVVMEANLQIANQGSGIIQTISHDGELQYLSLRGYLDRSIEEGYLSEEVDIVLEAARHWRRGDHRALARTIEKMPSSSSPVEKSQSWSLRRLFAGVTWILLTSVITWIAAQWFWGNAQHSSIKSTLWVVTFGLLFIYCLIISTHWASDALWVFALITVLGMLTRDAFFTFATILTAWVLFSWHFWVDPSGSSFSLTIPGWYIGTLAHLWKTLVFSIVSMGLGVGLGGCLQMISVLQSGSQNEDSMRLEHRYTNPLLDLGMHVAVLLVFTLSLGFDLCCPDCFDLLNVPNLLIFLIWVLKFHFDIELEGKKGSIVKIWAYLVLTVSTALLLFATYPLALERIVPAYHMPKINEFWVNVLVCLQIITCTITLIPTKCFEIWSIRKKSS